MSKVKKRLWMGTSVVVALAVAVGAVYAWTCTEWAVFEEDVEFEDYAHFYKGMKIAERGLRFGYGSVPSNPKIEWPDGQYIQGDDWGGFNRMIISASEGAEEEGVELRIWACDLEDHGGAILLDETKATLMSSSVHSWGAIARVTTYVSGDVIITLGD